MGDTKVKIAIEEEDDAWDILDDDFTNEVEEEINNTVEEDFLGENK